MTATSEPHALSVASNTPGFLNPPTLLVRAPTFRKPERAAGTLVASQATAPSPGAPHTPLRAPSPTPSRCSIDLPTYDDYEHIPQIPSPPRALSPYRDSYRQGHTRSASVPSNDYLDPASLELATPGRSRAQSHQRSRTELLPAFVTQTLQRTLSRSPSRVGSVRGNGGIRNSPAPSRSASPVKERSGSALSVRGSGVDDMGLTGDNRISASSRLRGANSSIDDGRAIPGAPGIKGLGSWISGAAAQVSASVTQSIVAAKNTGTLSPAVPGIGPPELERIRTNSTARSLMGGLESADSIKSGRATPGTPASSTSMSPRPAAPASSTPSFSTAKATLTSLFGGAKTTVHATPNPLEDELCTIDLGLALANPSEGTSAIDLHKTAMLFLKRYQCQYKARVQQVQSLKQEAEVRDEELEGEQVRARSLKAQLEAMSRTVQARDDTLQEIMEELEEKNAIIDQLAGISIPPEDVVAETEEAAERRRKFGTGTGTGTEDTESVFGSVSSGATTPQTEGLFTPATNTTANTSSASSIHSVTTPRQPQHRKSIATSSRHSLLSSDDLDKQPAVSPTKDIRGAGAGVYRCENCQGKSSSYAWIALSSVRTENQCLKDKCRELEEGINAALEGLGR